MKADMKGQLGSTDDTNGEERRGERWAVVTLQAYAETTSHTQRHTVPADVRQMGNLTMEELWTAESTWEPQGQEAASRQEHTALPRRRHVAESRICLATQLLNPCLRKIREWRLVTVNKTCSDLT
ncbi:hypothetical protein T03_9393 [Trichinella britovi]|uniref:Uncharacterized protein n=1 Tax=Trichinella britovi TaxID=45882 RepID=A0A0V1CF09_TRIBR|nr:hypothetical protein T03_9393 [Trichinella britovi]